MFYKFLKSGTRVPMDFDNIYEGQSCFIAGGSPVLLKENLNLLKRPGITVMSMNNTPSVVPTSIWIGGDKPQCYSPRILLDPKIMKFGMISDSRRAYEINGVKWQDCPNTYFFGISKNFTVSTLLKPHRDVVWWKNTFFMALQLAYRLGFRTVYLIGCQFKIERNRQYSYDMKLTEDQIKWNEKLYASTIANMKHLKPHFNDFGFNVISCTPESPLNEIYPTMSFNEAVDKSLESFPMEYDTDKCVHSSVFKAPKINKD